MNGQDLILSLENAFHGRGWQGPTLLGSLRGVSPQEATRTPKPLKNSIWQLALHAAYWKYAVCLKVAKAGGTIRGIPLEEGLPVFPRSPSNFPDVPRLATARQWRDDLQLLKDNHRALVTAVESLSTRQLDARPPGGKSWPLRSIVVGVAAHDAYHCGQIQVIKRLVRGGRGRGGGFANG
jgi:hypothetical protein